MTAAHVTTTRASARKSPAKRTPAKKVPAAAKKPADRKPAAARIEGAYAYATVRGVEYRIERAAMDDFEVLEQVQRGNWLPMLDLMLTPAQISDVKESVRDPETGRVPFSAMQDWFAELMGVFNPNS